MPTVRLLDPDGAIRDVPMEAVGGLLDTPGWRMPTRDDELGRVAAQATEANYGGAANAVLAGAAGAARGVSLGGSDALVSALGGEDAAYDLSQLREAHPGVSIATEVGGAIAPALLSAGASTPASAASLAGRGVARLAGGGLRGAVAGGAVEGAIYGAGSAVSELSLSPDPLTWEHATSSLSSNMLFGGVTGGIAGAAGHAVERGISRAKSAIDARLARPTFEAPVVAPELAALDDAGARAAYDAEHTGLTAARHAERQQFVDDLAAHRAEAVPVSSAQQSSGVRIFSAQVDDANAAIDKALGDPIGLARNPAAVSRHLDHQESAYKSLISVLDDEGGDTAAAVAGLEKNRAIRSRIDDLHTPVDSSRLQEIRRARQVDPATLDRNGIKSAEQFELKAIHAEQQPEREAFVQKLKDSFKQTQEEQVWNFTRAHPDRTMAGLGKEALEADKKIRKAIGNEVGLARDPEIILDALERQAQALEKIKSLGIVEHSKYVNDFYNGPATIRAEMAAGKIEGYKIGKGGLRPDSPLIDKGVREEMVKRFGSAERPILNTRLKAWENADAALGRNRELRAAIEKLKAEPTSPYLEALRSAKEQLGMPREKSVGEVLLHSIPFAGRFAEAASIGSKALGGLKAISAKAARRAGEAASTFLDVTGKAAAKATPYAPVVATKTLAALRYAPEVAGRSTIEAPKTLAGLFAARTQEIKSQTAYDQTGVPRLRPEARQAMAAQLRPIAAVDPILADRMETIATRRIEYLSSIIPRRPDFGTMSMGGHDLWHPSDMEMRSFARSAAAVEDPYAVLERALHGAVTPEDAAAVRNVHPEIINSFVNEISMGASGLARPLPFKRRLALSILTGKPIDPSMHPAVLSILQGQFAADGGVPMTSAPIAAPQFGSVKKSVPQPTPADRRAQGDQQI